jgi:TnpA family transposase
MRRLTIAVEVTALVFCVGCSRQDARLEQHKKNLESLGATTKVIAEAWLSGNVSGTYTRTALDQTFYLVEQERAKLVSRPEMLQDARGAALSEDAEQLSRLIASIIRDVGSADDESIRQRVASLPIVPHKQP